MTNLTPEELKTIHRIVCDAMERSKPVEKWAEERAAFARGETIQHKWDEIGAWKDNSTPGWLDVEGLDYRIKPAPVWSLTRHLKGFRPLKDGEEWHRVDGWKEEWLSGGWRPLLAKEIPDADVQVHRPADQFGLSGWSYLGKAGSDPADSWNDGAWFIRTRRPLPEPEREAFDGSPRVTFERWWLHYCIDHSDRKPYYAARDAWQAASRS